MPRPLPGTQARRVSRCTKGQHRFPLGSEATSGIQPASHGAEKQQAEEPVHHPASKAARTVLSRHAGLGTGRGQQSSCTKRTAEWGFESSKKAQDRDSWPGWGWSRGFPWPSAGVWSPTCLFPWHLPPPAHQPPWGSSPLGSCPPFVPRTPPRTSLKAACHASQQRWALECQVTWPGEHLGCFPWMGTLSPERPSLCT